LVKIIETNITYSESGEQNDFQSRVIEMESWESFVSEIKEGKSINRTSAIGNLVGLTLPREVKSINLTHDHFHMTLTFTNPVGNTMRKLAYLISE